MIEQVAGVAVTVSAALTLLSGYRVIAGPSEADRAVALDSMGTNVIGLAVVYAIYVERTVYINVSLLLAITGFMTTVLVSAYLEDGEVIS